MIELLLAIFLLFGAYLIISCVYWVIIYAIMCHIPKPGDYCTLVPDFDIGYICELHDDYYDDGGTKSTRKIYDKNFRKHIIVHGMRKQQPIRYTILAWVYYLGTRILGGLRYNLSK